LLDFQWDADIQRRLNDPPIREPSRLLVHYKSAHKLRPESRPAALTLLTRIKRCVLEELQLVEN
jgi:hypothetical protein